MFGISPLETLLEMDTDCGEGGFVWNVVTGTVECGVNRVSGRVASAQWSLGVVASSQRGLG